MSTIGDNIRKVRKRKGMTQEELAMQIGITPQAISRWESGNGLPDISMVVPLAQVLNVSTDILFGINDCSYNEVAFFEIKDALIRMDDSENPYQSSLEICEYLIGKLQENPANYDVCVLLVEKTANLSRYIGGPSKQLEMEKEEYAKWKYIKDCAMKYGMQVIRFGNNRQLEEKVHFALAWIYIHEQDYTSARIHVEALPSVASDRLQERLQGYLAFFEHGFDKQKEVVMKNCQNMIRTFNKELLYFMESCCQKAPEEAVEYGKWAMKIINVFMENDYMRVSCSGIVRDFHKYMMIAYLKRQRIGEAAEQYRMLQSDMRNQYEHYRMILNDEQTMSAYDTEQILHMEKYTEDFIEKKQKEILNSVKHGRAKGVYESFLEKLDMN